MIYAVYYKTEKKNYWINYAIYFTIFLFFSILNNINTNSFCKGISVLEDLYNEECFNNVIKFESKQYRVNNFAKNKKGDVILELTELNEDNNYEYSTSRLFYGITKEGYPFFENNTSYTHDFQINKSKELFNDNHYDNSINLFISLKNDLNKENEYLFSINSYNSMVELFNLNEDSNIFYSWSFNKFFNLNSDYYYEFQYELFELNGTNEYIIAFFPNSNITEEMHNISFIKKFSFKSFDEEVYDEINTINYSDYMDTRIVNIILFDDFFAVLTSIQIVEYYPYDPYYYEIYNDFYLKFYDFSLELFSSIKDIKINIDFQETGNKIFIKSLNIRDKYVVLIYYPYSDFLFELFDFNYIVNIEGKNQINSIISYFEYDYYCFDIDKSLSELIKIDNTKIAFIYTSFKDNEYNEYTEYNILCIFIIKIIENFSNFQIYQYYINFGNSVPNVKILGYSYNDHLIFATTSLFNNMLDNNKNYLSLFMMFGYENGIDKLVNISLYLNNDNNNQLNIDLYELFNKSLNIENNLFQYTLEKTIKIVTIP